MLSTHNLFISKQVKRKNIFLTRKSKFINNLEKLSK